jgi:hypothetical protein
MNFFLGLFPLYRNIDKNLKVKWVINHIALSKINSYCYFRLPKCANSTVTRTLAHYDPLIHYNSETDQNGYQAKKQLNVKIDALLLTPQKVLENYFTFTFVRNPYARTLSAYLDKVASDNTQFKDIRRKVALFGSQGFESFVTYLENGGTYENIHFVGQCNLLPLCPSKLHFIGRVEKLEADLEFVINRIFGEGVYKMAQTSQNAVNHSHNLLSQYYDDSLRKRVYAIYENDFKALGYAP